MNMRELKVKVNVDIEDLKDFRDILKDTAKAAQKLGLTRKQTRYYLKSHIEVFREYRQQET